MPNEVGAMLRAARRAQDAGLRTTPRWLAIRHTQFAIRVHDVVYGGEVRPLTRAARLSWTRLLAFYTRSRMLTYAEVLRVAGRLAEELRAAGTALRPTPEVDESLRRVLSERLTAAARAVERAGGRRRATAADLCAARMSAHARQDLLDGVCPWCGAVLPCGFHDLPRVSIDGTGGLVRVETPHAKVVSLLPRDFADSSARAAIRSEPSTVGVRSA